MAQPWVAVGRFFRPVPGAEGYYLSPYGLGRMKIVAAAAQASSALHSSGYIL